MVEHRHFIIHKPDGYLSQFVNNERRKKNKKLLGDLFNFPEGTMSIGRLDEDSEGLLLLTTDGMMSELVRSSKIEKEYYALVDGTASEADISLLKAGVSIGVNGTQYQTKPCEAKLLNPQPAFHPRKKRVRDDRHGPSTWISITLNEGKNRQVRKMTAAIGLPTLRLVRVRIGHLKLNELEHGKITEIESFGFKP